MKQTITAEMISNFEGNNRSKCLFCEAHAIGLLEYYQPDDIPHGFYCMAYECYSCGKAWREITRLEEIEI